MKKILIKSLSVAILITAMLPMTVFAGSSSDTETGTYAGNTFAAGSNPVIRNADAQDIFCAGQTAGVAKSKAAGNIFAAGNTVEIRDVNVNADVFAAGNVVDIDEGYVNGNILAAGNIISIEGVSTGGVVAAGNSIEFEGIAEEAILSGTSVVLNGSVDGDVTIEADSVVIGEYAVVNGTLTVKAPAEPTIPDNAQISGYEYEVRTQTEAESVENVKKAGIFAKALRKITSRFYWIPAMVIFGLLLCLLFGKDIDEAKELIKDHSIEYVLEGALGWLLIPVAAFILAVTVIGLPAAGIILTAYVVLLCAGMTFAGASLGRLVFGKLHPILASIIGIAILECVKIIPLIGGIVAVAADMYLIGYVVNRSHASIVAYKESKKPVYAVAVEEPIEAPTIEESASTVDASASGDNE